MKTEALNYLRRRLQTIEHFLHSPVHKDHMDRQSGRPVMDVGRLHEEKLMLLYLISQIENAPVAA